MNNEQFHNISERLDLFLFKVRLFKSRTLATKACIQETVLINNQIAKPSSRVRLDDILTLKQLFGEKKYQVIGFAQKNMTKNKAKKMIKFLN